MTIAIINYGAGNLGSIQNMLKKIGAHSYICDRPEQIASTDKLILPGVGSFDTGMGQLIQSGFLPVLNDLVLNQQRPILGICLGMQLMTNGSEEGGFPGLGWIDASTKKLSINSDQKLRVPHMGWNTVQIKKSNELFENNETEVRFYFVHSYHVVCNDSKDILTTTPFNGKFTSSFQKNNIYGVQFHPEKSHRYGFDLLKKFSDLSK